MELKDYSYDLRIDPSTKNVILRFQLKYVPTDNWTSIFNRNIDNYNFVNIIGTSTIIVTLNAKDFIESSYSIILNRYYDSSTNLFVSGKLSEVFLPSLKINGVLKYFKKNEYPIIETIVLLLEITADHYNENDELIPHNIPIGEIYTVTNDGSGKQSPYMWDGSNWIKISDTYNQKIEVNLLDVMPNSGIVKITFDDNTHWSYDYSTGNLQPDKDFYPEVDNKSTYPSDFVVHTIHELNPLLTACFDSINVALSNFDGSGSAYSSYSYTNYFTELLSNITKTDEEFNSDLNKQDIYKRVMVPGICIVHDGLNSVGSNSELENFLRKVVNNQTLS